MGNSPVLRRQFLRPITVRHLPLTLATEQRSCISMRPSLEAEPIKDLILGAESLLLVSLIITPETDSVRGYWIGLAYGTGL